MANEDINVDIRFQTNAEETNRKVDNLGNSILSTTSKTDLASKSTTDYSKSLKNNGLAILENGGAMGLLNDLTGGYAMMIKDAVEAAELFTKAKKVDTVATGALTTATNVQTTATVAAETATATWTATLLANPVVAITAAIVALGVAVYAVTKYFIAERDAAAELNSELAITKLRTENLSKAVDESRDTYSDMNTLEIARAKAMGASSAQIDKLIQKQKELDIQQAESAKKQAQIDRDLASKSLRKAISSGDEDKIKEAEANLKAANELEKKYSNDYNKALLNSEVTRLEIQEKAHNKEVEAVKKKNEKIAKINEETAAKDKAVREKVVADKLASNKESFEKALKIVNDLSAKSETPVEREEREYKEKKTVLEDNYLNTEELTKQHLDNLSKINKDAEDKAKEEREKTDTERRDKGETERQLEIDLLTTRGETTISKMKEGFDKERAIVDLEEKVKLKEEENRFKKLTEAQQKDADQIALHEAKITQISDEAKKSRDKIRQAENIAIANNINDAIKQIGALSDAFAAGDNASVASKKKSIKRETAVKVAGIAGDTTVGIMKGFADLPTPAAWVNAAVVGTLGATSIIKAVKSGKEQMAALGGGDAGANAGAAEASIPAAAKPSVSFVSSSNNQLQSTISNVNSNQAPIKTYVTITDVNTAQELERKTVEKGIIG